MQNQSYYTETLKDKFTLSPLQQYKKYNRWPYKLIISCCLVVLTSIQAVFVSKHFQFNNPQLMNIWDSTLLGSYKSRTNNIRYFTILEFQDAFTRTLSQIEILNDLTIFKVSNENTSVTMDLKFNEHFDGYNDDNLRYKYKLPIGQKIKKPFDQDSIQQIKKFWKNVKIINLKISDLTVYLNDLRICWDIIISYQNSPNGYIYAQISSMGGVCEHNQNYQLLVNEGQIGLQMLIIFLATIDLVMNIKYIYEVIEMYTRNIYFQKRIHQFTIPDHKLRGSSDLKTLKIILQQQLPWHMLSFREKILFFDLFLPLRITGNISQILASAVILTQDFFRIDSIANYSEFFVGMGCFLAWFSVAKYLKYFQKLHIIVGVLESSIIPVGMAIISFTPVFMGYLFLGMCLFINSSRFQTFGYSALTLYELLFQDQIYDIVVGSSMQENLKTAMFYYITYILFFTMAFTNIMIALIQEQLEKRKQVNEKENDLMEGFNIKPQVFQIASTRTNSRLQSFLSNVDPNNLKRRQHISFKTVAKLAVLLQRKKGKKITQQTLEQDWSRLAGQEIQKHYLNIAIHDAVQSIQDHLYQMEKEIIKDIVIFNFRLREKKEILQLYCNKLVGLNQKLQPLLLRLNPIYRKLSLEVRPSKESN